MFKNLFFFLFSHFSVGLICTIFLVSLAEIGKLFFRVNTSIAFLMILGAILVQPFGNIDLFFFSGSDISSSQIWQQSTYLLFLLYGLSLVAYNIVFPRFNRPLLALSLVLGLSGIGFYTIAAAQSATNPAVGFVTIVLHGLASTLALGSVLGAMITGHWYLVQHKLSITPLKKSSGFFLLSTLFRIILVAVTLGFYWHLSADKLLVLFTSLSLASGILYFRLAFGLLLPVVFGFMIWSAVKMHSTQSATGMLYATIILVLIGEIFGRVLSMSVGLPL